MIIKVNDMMIKRSTILYCTMGLLTVTAAVFVSLVLDLKLNRPVPNQEEIAEEDSAHYYELENIYYDGRFVTGVWTNEVGEEEDITAELPSLGCGIVHNGGRISLQSYEEPEDGILEDCFYWSGM